jgi:HEAT repeat protein
MPIPSDHPLARTLALRDPELAACAAAAFRGTTELAEVEGLVELLLNREASATACSAALRSLEHDTSALVSDAIVLSLANPFPSIRIVAAQEATRRGLFAQARDALRRNLHTDTFWQVRRAAAWAIGAEDAAAKWDTLHAATDPHWRVRYALAQMLAKWDAADVMPRLEAVGGPRAERLRDYLAYQWTGTLPPERETPDPVQWCPFWDWDPAVLARNIDRLGRGGRRLALDTLIRLVNHPDERVRAQVVRALRDDGKPPHWADAIGRLNDPREDIATPVADLVSGFELDRVEAVAKFILRQESPAPAALRWAMGQVGEAFPAEEVTEELERHQAPFSPARSRDDRPWAFGPSARAAALTPESARALLDSPTDETSWVVLDRAAKLCKTPVWKLEPETPWTPPPEPIEARPPITLPPIELVRPVQIGPGGPFVSPLGVSGHYGLPAEGFARAADVGVNFFFWEPNYATLTRFVTQITPTERRSIHLLVGTFEAEPAKIRKDVDRALKNMKLDRISVFLIFWTQSWQRVTPDVREELERLKDDGKVQVFGLSTHVRALAADAIRDGWNPVMVRHSAAHRKAESEVFPVAREHGASIITFNNTCYGRLLDPSFRPSDCFRFTLNTPGVSACFTAPSTLEQLDENLDALRNPALDEAVRERLLKRGEWMYREDTVFRKTVRADV